MLLWTEVTQSQATLPDAMILKVNVYFDWHIAAPSLTIMQQKSGNNSMCTLYMFVVIYYDIKQARLYLNVWVRGFGISESRYNSHLHEDSLSQQTEMKVLLFVKSILY